MRPPGRHRWRRPEGAARPVRGVDAACAVLTDLIDGRVDARDGLMISL
jgi:hypothetical protein